MKYWYDCEFFENGRTIDLISIGIVAEDGREYYAVNEAIRTSHELWFNIKCSEWLLDNVIPHIMPKTDFEERKAVPEMLTRLQIREEVENFLGFSSTGKYSGAPELWGLYSTYDHMALNQLWGQMVNKPSWMPWITHDIASYAELFGLKSALLLPPPEQHHALVDARWHRSMYQELSRHVKGKTTYHLDLR